jgi:hypothetical protein
MAMLNNQRVNHRTKWAMVQFAKCWIIRGFIPIITMNSSMILDCFPLITIINHGYFH